MEAKDTVMTTEQIKQTWETWSPDKTSPPSFDQWLCLAQAEISFYAGKAEGIKEVVEDIYKVIANSDYDIASIIRSLDKWQSKGL